MFPLCSAVSKHEEGASSEGGTFSLRDPVPLSRCVQGYALSRRCRMDAHSSGRDSSGGQTPVGEQGAEVGRNAIEREEGERM